LQKRKKKRKKKKKSASFTAAKTLSNDGWIAFFLSSAKTIGTKTSFSVPAQTARQNIQNMHT
jgi:DNA polymerase III delta subunit